MVFRPVSQVSLLGPIPLRQSKTAHRFAIKAAGASRPPVLEGAGIFGQHAAKCVIPKVPRSGRGARGADGTYRFPGIVQTQDQDAVLVLLKHVLIQAGQQRVHPARRPAIGHRRSDPHPASPSGRRVCRPAVRSDLEPRALPTRLLSARHCRRRLRSCSRPGRRCRHPRSHVRPPSGLRSAQVSSTALGQDGRRRPSRARGGGRRPRVAVRLRPPAPAYLRPPARSPGPRSRGDAGVGEPPGHRSCGA